MNSSSKIVRPKGMRTSIPGFKKRFPRHLVIEAPAPRQGAKDMDGNPASLWLGNQLQWGTGCYRTTPRFKTH